MWKSALWTALKGLLVGSSMLVPGVSGGTTAIMLGIYDRLIKAISSLFSDFRRNLAFLAVFCAGAFAGIALLSRLLLWIVNAYEMPAMYFFLGAILGSIPMLRRKSTAPKLRPSLVLAAILGFAAVLAIGAAPAPEGAFSGDGIARIGMLFIAGLVIAAALVLPGISTSQMLLVLGMYETTLGAIKDFDIGFLAPLCLGGLAGILLVTKLIERLLDKAPAISYFAIIGFVIGSVVDVLPGFPAGLGILACAATFAAGFAAIYLATRKTGS